MSSSGLRPAADDEDGGSVVVAPSAAGGRAVRLAGAARRSLIRPRPIAAIIGMSVGVVLGLPYGYLASVQPSGSFFPPAGWIVIVFTIGLVVGGLGLLGLALLVRVSTRRAGGTLLLAGAFVVAGLPVGSSIGPRWQPPPPLEQLAGQVTLDLQEPLVARLTSAALCEKEPDGGPVVRLRVPRLGTIGVDEVGADVHFIDPAGAIATVTITVNSFGWLSGSLTVAALDQARTAGVGTIVRSPAESRSLGGQTGGMVAGTLSWTCGATAVETPRPGEGPGELQGYFSLGGIITVPEARATGSCSRELDLRTDGIETVVDWADGRRARLRLVPGRENATLTVTYADGSAPQSASAPARLVEYLMATTGEVTHSRLQADFALPAGALKVTVEWDCARGDQEQKGP